MFNVAAIKRCTRSEGPHRRAAIWFQGCDIRCEGCCNPEFIPLVIRNRMHLSELLSVIDASASEFGIEGVTLLGGEPTLQSGIPSLCIGIRERGLGVILFTGRTYENLPREITENVDMVVDGRFEKDLPETSRNMIGSSNQRIIDVSGRYAGDISWFTGKREKRVEISLNGDLLDISGDYVPLDRSLHILPDVSNNISLSVPLIRCILYGGSPRFLCISRNTSGPRPPVSG